MSFFVTLIFTDIMQQRVQNVIKPLIQRAFNIPNLPKSSDMDQALYSVFDYSHLFQTLNTTPYYDEIRHEQLVLCFAQLTFYTCRIITLLPCEMLAQHFSSSP